MDGPGPARPAACEKDGLKDESGTAAKDTISIGSSDRVSGADRMGVEVHNINAKLQTIKSFAFWAYSTGLQSGDRLRSTTWQSIRQ